MKRWIALVCVVASLGVAAAQQESGSRANDLYKAGKKVDALPLYEELAKQYPNEWLYQERLADCLNATVAGENDAQKIVRIRTRVRDAAKRAVELGDPNEYLHILANIDPAKPVDIAAASPGAALLKEAEKAYGAGDFTTAMAKYKAAAEADPQLYEAPLFAGDTAYVQHDLKSAAEWFARAIKIDPNRETAYRYWGDAILRDGNDAGKARDKFIDAIVAEPYNKLAWQGLQQWAQREQAVLMPPKIDRPAAPVADPKKPNNINITLDAAATDDKKHPGASAWLMYSMMRASYQMEVFKKDHPNEKEYRHSLKEEDMALSTVAESLDEKKTKPSKLDESLRNLQELNKAGMLDCWILISAPDQGIAQDYAAYRKDHRQLLHDYIDRFVVHGGVNPQRER